MRFILPAISALLLIPAYPNFNLGFLAWIALIPLFFSMEKGGVMERAAKGYLFGLLFFSGVLYWLFKISVPGTIGLVLALSAAPAIFSALYRPYRSDRYISLLGVPSAWVLTEYLRAHLFTGFPWALLGYSQSLNIPLIQIADITGVYGISFLLVISNYGLYLTIRKAPHRLAALSLIVMLIGLTLAYGQLAIRSSCPGGTVRVAVIQGNIPQEMKWDPKFRSFIVDRYRAITRDAVDEGRPGLIVWPETALPGYMEDDGLRRMISDLARSEGTRILTGALHGEGPDAYNSAYLVSASGELLQRYDKIHLVPFGEFIPFEKTFSWVRSRIDKPMGDFMRGRNYTVFKLSGAGGAPLAAGPDVTAGNSSFSCLICYEDIFPELSRRFVRGGAQFLVNITNDAWFGKTSAPYQHAQGSIFRAVENRVPVVRAANTGFSCIIDPMGRIEGWVEKGNAKLFVDGYAIGSIGGARGMTFYTRFGDLFSLACILFALIQVGLYGLDPARKLP